MDNIWYTEAFMNWIRLLAGSAVEHGLLNLYGTSKSMDNIWYIDSNSIFFLGIELWMIESGEII